MLSKLEEIKDQIKSLFSQCLTGNKEIGTYNSCIPQKKGDNTVILSNFDSYICVRLSNSSNMRSLSLREFLADMYKGN